MQANVNETLRYLGVKEPDAKILSLIKTCADELSLHTQPSFVHREYPLTIGAEELMIGPMEFRSSALREHLLGCPTVSVFAATLGPEADRLIHRYSVTDMARALIISAAATAMLEDYCDEAVSRIAEPYKAQSLLDRPRFSPGYGDFSLACQKDILSLADARRIGITLTDSSMMAPIKSVTAIVGFGPPVHLCCPNPCSACEKRDCLYRKDS